MFLPEVNFWLNPDPQFFISSSFDKAVKADKCICVPYISWINRDIVETKALIMFIQGNLERKKPLTLVYNFTNDMKEIY